MATTDAAERQKHKEMVEDPERWPRWPLLPVKKRESFLESGYLVACEGRMTTVVLGNMYGVPKQVKCLGDFFSGILPVKVYDSVDAMLDDGWIVD